MNQWNPPLTSPEVQSRERPLEAKLRPQGLKDFIGQKKIVENLKIMMVSAQKRQGPLDHILLSGPPGLGKTSLAMLVSRELGRELHTISAPALEKKGDLAAIVTNMNDHDILFIDEIHRMPMPIEEILYSAMEDFRLDIIIGQGPSARTVQIDLPPFTLIGATTRSGLLSRPLRDRFMAHLHFDFYEVQSLIKILETNAQKLHLPIHPQGLKELAARSRGTPRIANRLLRRVRDFHVAQDLGEVELKHVEEALRMMEIDQKGLDSMDRKILSTIDETYSGGPVGIEALCATLNEDRGTIEDVYEPFLLKEGLLMRSPRGRALTEKGKSHLNS